MRLTNLVILCGLMICGAHANAEDLRIAVLDMSRLITAHPKTAANRALLERQITELEADLKAMVEKYEKEKAAYLELVAAAEHTALSAEARAEKKLLADAKRDELREFAQGIRRSEAVGPKQLQDERRRMRRHVVGSIREIVAEHAAREGYTLVLDSSSGGTGAEPVVYSSVRTDITEEVVKLITGNATTE